MLKSLYEIENFELFLSCWDIYKEEQILSDLIAIDENCYCMDRYADTIVIAMPTIQATVTIQFDDYGYVMAVGVSH